MDIRIKQSGLMVSHSKVPSSGAEKLSPSLLLYKIETHTLVSLFSYKTGFQNNIFKCRISISGTLDETVNVKFKIT